jgi:hypothetical protein
VLAQAGQQNRRRDAVDAVDENVALDETLQILPDRFVRR